MWFILRGDLFYVLPCGILFLCFSVILAFRLPRLEKSHGKRKNGNFKRKHKTVLSLFDLNILLNS